MGFSRQEYWSGLPFPSPRDLPDPGIEPTSPMSLVLAGRSFTTSATWEAWEAYTHTHTHTHTHRASLVAPMVKKLPAMQETWV